MDSRCHHYQIIYPNKYPVLRSNSYLNGHPKSKNREHDGQANKEHDSDGEKGGGMNLPRMAEPFDTRFDRSHAAHGHTCEHPGCTRPTVRTLCYTHQNQPNPPTWEPPSNLTQQGRETLDKRREARDKEEMRKAGIMMKYDNGKTYP